MEQLLIEYQNGTQVNELMKKYKLSVGKFYRILSKNGIDTRASKIDWNTIQDQVLLLYKEGIGCTEIGKKLGISSKKASAILRSNNIEVKGGAEYIREHSVDSSYFEKIDSPEKAYWLGLLYADGNIYLKRNRLQITLLNEDSYLLTRLANQMQSTRKLYIDRVKYSKLIVDSPKIIKDLITLGCIPNKTFIITYPRPDQLPECWDNHFIRGYFDGNGCISIRKEKHLNPSISGCKFIIEHISTILQKEGIECGIWYKRYKDKELSGGDMPIKRTSAEKFYSYLYNDCGDMYMKRKKIKFDKAMNHED